MSVPVISILVRVVRWEPGARDRLRAAALQLFARHGYEQTTAAEIAQAAGVTERTFFRHFTDKREVLFHGQRQLDEAFRVGIDAAPPDAPALAVVAAALRSAGSFFTEERRPDSRLRQTVIDANPSLRERELLKMAGLARTIGAALRARGVGEPAATLAAELGVTVFGIAFAQWIRDGEQRSLADISDEILRALRDIVVEAL